MKSDIGGGNRFDNSMGFSGGDTFSGSTPTGGGTNFDPFGHQPNSDLRTLANLINS